MSTFLAWFFLFLLVGSVLTNVLLLAFLLFRSKNPELILDLEPPPPEPALIAEIYGKDLLVMDGYDDCIIGVCERYAHDPFVVYDLGRVIQRLMDDGMTADEAREYFEHNQLGAYVGQKTPGFLDRM